MSTCDAEVQKARIAELKRKMLEVVDFLTTWEEAEAKKKAAESPEVQD